jgi:hypothetical protein
LLVNCGADNLNASNRTIVKYHTLTTLSNLHKYDPNSPFGLMTEEYYTHFCGKYNIINRRQNIIQIKVDTSLRYLHVAYLQQKYELHASTHNATKADFFVCSLAIARNLALSFFSSYTTDQKTRTNLRNRRQTAAISGSNGSSGLGLLTFSCMMASTGQHVHR